MRGIRNGTGMECDNFEIEIFLLLTNMKVYIHAMRAVNFNRF